MNLISSYLSPPSAIISHTGTLAQISMEDSSISLHNVKSFGTEGRRMGMQVPPSHDIYEYIIFKGEGIDELATSNALETRSCRALRIDIDRSLITSKSITSSHR